MAEIVEGYKTNSKHLIHENYRYSKSVATGFRTWVCVLKNKPKPFRCNGTAYTKKIDGIEKAFFKNNHNKAAHDKYDVQYEEKYDVQFDAIEWPGDYKIYLKGGFEVEKSMKLFKFFSHICK